MAPPLVTWWTPLLGATLVLTVGLLPLHAHAGGERLFDPQKDTPYYANETVFAYSGRPAEDEEGHRYTRRCFVLSKGVVQFWRFAEFAPDAPRLDPEVLTPRLVEICRRPPWVQNTERLQIPGFRDLRELSEVHGEILRREMGAWWPTYLRFGNMRIMMPSPVAGRLACAEWIEQQVATGEIVPVLLSRVPEMVHAVVIHGVEREGEMLRFTVYDPNLVDQPQELRFDPVKERFVYGETFFFSGGAVNVLRIYLSPLH